MRRTIPTTWPALYVSGLSPSASSASSSHTLRISKGLPYECQQSVRNSPDRSQTTSKNNLSVFTHFYFYFYKTNVHTFCTFAFLEFCTVCLFVRFYVLYQLTEFVGHGRYFLYCYLLYNNWLSVMCYIIEEKLITYCSFHTFFTVSDCLMSALIPTGVQMSLCTLLWTVATPV